MVCDLLSGNFYKQDCARFKRTMPRHRLIEEMLSDEYSDQGTRVMAVI